MDANRTAAAGCYPRHPSYTVWTGDPPLFKQTAAPFVPGIQEQLGIDPISKLAAAIEKLADALREGTRD